MDQRGVSALAALRRLAEDRSKPLALLPHPAGALFSPTTSGRSPGASLGTLAGSARLKRVLDVLLALPLLLVVLPVLAATAVAILVADGRPVFFRQWRVGRDGVPFKMYKFRTMVRDAEQRLSAYSSGNERHGPLFN